QIGLYHFSDLIIVHSKLSMHEIPSRYHGNVRIIPHPNYINEYGRIITENDDTENNQKLKLLFIGQIKPYKNIELLINAVSNLKKSEVILTIAGRPLNVEYKNKLEEIARQSENINLVLKFIDDNDIRKYLCAHDLVILPYDINSSLNSGTAILAFSYMKTIICPKIGTLDEMR